jgi:hypothetical protein
VIGETDKELCIFYWQKELADRIEQLAQIVRAQRQEIGGQP